MDTENESASLYADRYNFDTIPLDPPFESERYIVCIDYAVANGYDVLILDGITPQWDGEGGILRRKEELDRRPGSNSFTNWATFTPEHTHFIEAIKQSQVHTICTMRSKQDYILEQNDKGKSKPVKMGMAPIQRDGFDYEFTLVFDVQMDHKAVAIKNRTTLFGEKLLNLADKKVADQLKAWLESGKPAEAATVPVVAPVLVGKPPQPTNGKAPAKVDCWKLDRDKLDCYVYDAQKKKSKKGSDFVVVKHNGSVNGTDVAFCFQENLFECLLASKGHRAVLFVDLGDYIGIADVMEIDGVEFRDGQPYKKAEEAIAGQAINDSDLPF